MYILDCEINIVSNSTKYSSNQDYSFPLSYQDGELLWTGTQQERWSLPLPFIKTGLSCTATARRVSSRSSVPCLLHSISRSTMSMSRKPGCLTAARRSHLLDKLKALMSKSSKDTCDRESGDLSRTRKSESFSPFAKFQQFIFQLIIFSYFTKKLLIFLLRGIRKSVLFSDFVLYICSRKRRIVHRCIQNPNNMKNILLAVAVFAAAFVSCNKETEVVPSPNSFTDGARIALTLTDDAADRC